MQSPCACARPLARCQPSFSASSHRRTTQLAESIEAQRRNPAHAYDTRVRQINYGGWARAETTGLGVLAHTQDAHHVQGLALL